MKRVQLLPTTRLHRDSRAVQLGLSPGRSVIIESARPALFRLLGLLDGTRSESVIRHEASRLGVPIRDTTLLLGTLRERRLLSEPGALLPRRLTPATRRRLEPEATALALRELTGGTTPALVLHRRRQQRVLLVGHSRLIGPMASLLAASGIGRVHPTAPGSVVGADPSVGGLLPADARRPARRALCDAVLRAAPDTDTRAVADHEADLVVLLGRPRPTPAVLIGRALRSVRHLTVWVRDGTVVIGPMVRPGVTTCLDCVELHRRDRDPRWPVLAAQLATSPTPAEPAEATLVSMGAAVAAGQVLSELDGGDPDTLGGTLEVSPPATVRRRDWQPHPHCGCLSPRRRRQP